MPGTVVCALGSPDTTSQVTTGRPPARHLDEAWAPLTEGRPKGDRALAVTGQRRLGEIDLLRGTRHLQMGHVGVIVRVIAELDQRVPGQLRHDVGGLSTQRPETKMVAGTRSRSKVSKTARSKP